MFVSHNRAFIRRLATRIWDVHDGTVEDYPGTLDEYLDRHRLEGEPEPEEAPAKAEPADEPRKADKPKDEPPANRKAQRREQAQRRAERSKKLGPLQKKVTALEAQIATLEERQREHNLALADPSVYDDEAKRSSLLSAYQQDSAALSELTDAWEVAQSELEALEAELD